MWVPLFRYSYRGRNGGIPSEECPENIPIFRFDSTTMNRSIRTRQRDNAAPCTVSACHSQRHGVSPFCQLHMRAALAHGHPLGRHLPRRLYELEAREVRAILRRNAQHPALRAATEWAAAWLETAGGAELRAPADMEVSRLARHGVTSIQIVEEVAALWTFARRNPTRVADDSRLTFALANAVLRLAPRDTSRSLGKSTRYSRCNRDARAALGKQIRTTLGVFLQNLAVEVDRLAQARAEMRDALATPLDASFQ